MVDRVEMCDTDSVGGIILVSNICISECNQKRLYVLRNNTVIQTVKEVFYYNARRMYSRHSSADETFVKRRSI